jgi:hypothetical protein
VQRGAGAGQERQQHHNFRHLAAGKRSIGDHTASREVVLSESALADLVIWRPRFSVSLKLS